LEVIAADVVRKLTCHWWLTQRWHGSCDDMSLLTNVDIIADLAVCGDVAAWGFFLELGCKTKGLIFFSIVNDDST
jgi:hypothetical protein